jgi:hypothetical protein
MTASSGDTEQATTVELFSRMKAEGIEYAVLRNYEFLPEFGHDIDLVVRWSDLPRWRRVAETCASNHGWSALTECDHWARSTIREHTIQILRFYCTSPLQYLQVDAFHALLLNGLPLFDEDALLRGRVWDERGFYRIDARAENLFRLLQIARLSRASGAGEKVKRYRDRALSFWGGADLLSFASDAGMPGIVDAMEHLKSGDLASFKREIDQQKRVWWLSRAAGRPWHSSKMVVGRLADYLRLFWLRPCGFGVRAFAANEGQKRRLEAIASRLVEANLIPAFTMSGKLKERRRVKERGGLVIEWASSPRKAMVLGDTAGDESVTAELVKSIIERHPRMESCPSADN